MSEQDWYPRIEEVEVAAAEATEESAAIEQQAEEATEAVEVAEQLLRLLRKSTLWKNSSPSCAVRWATGMWFTPTPATRTR